MNDQIRQLVDQAARTSRAAETAKAHLAAARSRCPHLWGTTVYDPIVQAGYRTQDLMGPFHTRTDGTIDAPWIDVPRSETPRWTRTCTKCGLPEHTEQTTEHVTKTPRF